ncbi:MAG: hypothetical protein WAW37_13985 [Syntrophobacteraceae bacterium]
MALSCGFWKCEECRDKKARAVMARALKGMIADDAQRAGFRERYNFKTLTLTCPGAEFRMRYTREEAAVQMRDAFRKLILFLRKQLGYFSYIRVTEDQKDGYPHYHVTLCGPNIAPKWVLRMIEDAWRGEYGMGFVKLHKIYEVEKAIKYVLKYLFKDPAWYQDLRLFTYSRDALLKKNPPDTKWENIQMTWGNYKNCEFSGACFRGQFIRSDDGRKVMLEGRCLWDMFQLEACFDDTEGGLKWVEGMTSTERGKA